MSANIFLNYKQAQMTHFASDDIESLVYVLIWMCMLYVGPGTLHEDKHVSKTVLKPWVMVSTATNAVTLGAFKEGLKYQPKIMTNKFTRYFKPLCPVVNKLLRELGRWSTTDHINHYKAVRNVLVEGFGTVEEVPNWNAAKDMHGYGLLEHDPKRKVLSWATDGYDLEAEAESSRAVRRPCRS